MRFTMQVVCLIATFHNKRSPERGFLVPELHEKKPTGGGKLTNSALGTGT